MRRSLLKLTLDELESADGVFCILLMLQWLMNMTAKSEVKDSVVVAFLNISCSTGNLFATIFINYDSSLMSCLIDRNKTESCLSCWNISY